MLKQVYRYVYNSESTCTLQIFSAWSYLILATGSRGPEAGSCVWQNLGMDLSPVWGGDSSRLAVPFTGTLGVVKFAVAVAQTRIVRMDIMLGRFLHPNRGGRQYVWRVTAYCASNDSCVRTSAISATDLFRDIEGTCSVAHYAHYCRISGGRE
jgi:hypothetical protein